MTYYNGLLVDKRTIGLKSTGSYIFEVRRDITKQLHQQLPWITYIDVHENITVLRTIVSRVSQNTQNTQNTLVYS